MEQYPFCRLSGPANVLVMPAFHSASISTKMLQELGGSTVIGPLLVGLDKPVQITSLGAKDSATSSTWRRLRPIRRVVLGDNVVMKERQRQSMAFRMGAGE
jgi:metallophosphoesterase superfamily enzyme